MTRWRLISANHPPRRTKAPRILSWWTDVNIRKREYVVMTKWVHSSPKEKYKNPKVGHYFRDPDYNCVQIISDISSQLNSILTSSATYEEAYPRIDKFLDNREKELVSSAI